MKKILNLLSVFTLVGVMCSCGGKNDPEPIIYPANTFDDDNGLTLTVNGEPMIGQTAEFTQNASDGFKATIKLSSTMDFSDLDEMDGVSIPGLDKVQCPGPVPGSKVLTLDVTLENGTDNSTFSGNQETEYCTFNYAGTVTDKELTVKITDLTLKDKTLVGDWTPLPYAINDDFSSDNYGAITSNPVYVVWKSDANLNFLGSPLPVESLLSLVMAMPILNNNTATMPEALNRALKQVNFQSDGNIIAKYVDEDDLSENPTVLTSPANVAQYAVTGTSDMRLYLNPWGIALADRETPQMKKTRADVTIPSLDSLIPNVLAQLTPMLGDGVPMHYNLNGSDLKLYLGTDVLLPLLKQISPMLKDQQVIDMIVAMVSQDPSMGMFAAFLPDMLKSMADVIDNTTQIEIGLNLKK